MMIEAIKPIYRTTNSLRKDYQNEAVKSEKKDTSNGKPFLEMLEKAMEEERNSSTVF